MVGSLIADEAVGAVVVGSLIADEAVGTALVVLVVTLTTSEQPAI